MFANQILGLMQSYLTYTTAAAWYSVKIQLYTPLMCFLHNKKKCLACKQDTETSANYAAELYHDISHLIGERKRIFQELIIAYQWSFLSNFL